MKCMLDHAHIPVTYTLPPSAFNTFLSFVYTRYEQGTNDILFVTTTLVFWSKKRKNAAISTNPG